MSARAWIVTIAVAVLLCSDADRALAGFACGAPRPPGDPGLIEHPKKAKAVTVNLVQAFEHCFAPDTTTEGGFQACTATTRNAGAGNPMTGWRWGAAKARGLLRLSAACPGAADVGVTLQLAGVVDGMGTPVTGSGTLEVGARLALDDPVGGSMTTVNLPLTIPFGLTDGKVKFRTTAAAMLATAALPPLPNVTSFELAPSDLFDQEAGLLEVRDGNGTVFLRPGLESFPKAGTAPCDVPHGGKAKPVKLSLVQAYVPCDPMFANAATAGGIDACAPAETFREEGGSLPDAWRWSPSGGGTLTLAAKNKPACADTNANGDAGCTGPLNPAGDTSDVLVTLKLKGLIDGSGAPVDGTGALFVLGQVTMHDRANGPVTLLLPISHGVQVKNGRATMKTSQNVFLNMHPVLHPSLPTCVSYEILAATVSDLEVGTFATAGLWLP